ncbi:hypothetical protein R1sor_024572 [Riccia sorocarpa]|uniref:Fungal lipase-type domain-containing protein n=1 Tax=Riccia sorocarpa TaxID=122646 RepID=A0ABD3GSS4_9MARC
MVLFSDCKQMAPAADLDGLKPGGLFEDDEPTKTAKKTQNYVVADPLSGWGHRGVTHYFWDLIRGDSRWKTGFDYSDQLEDVLETNHTWQAKVSVACLKILWNIYGPFKAIGHFVEDILNLFVSNGGFFSTLFRLFIPLLWSKLIILDREHAEYKSFLALLDPRVHLYTTSPGSSPEKIDTANAVIFPGTEYGSKFTADVLVMSAKIAYENANYIQRVVGKFWRMNFVGFYDCWNEFQGEMNTQVFIFTDRPVDARAVVVAWRGTEPFNTLDWSTDFDFSWIEIEGFGKVHVGFLEALGLIDRKDPNTFLQLHNRSNSQRSANQENADHTESNASGLRKEVRNNKYKKLAYDHVTTKVKFLMRTNPNAKLFVTGHSLGGALANLYTGLLFFLGEDKLTDRLAAVYTFGQPRVGAEDYSQYLISKLNERRYWRVVYSNDLVPRIPFDGPIFQFKHSGYCFFYDERYTETTLQDVPNRNYFSLKISVFIEQRVGALYDLILSIFSGWIYGPDFRENWIALATRSTGLIIPGMCGHLLNNYVNAVRLGPTVLESKLHDHSSFGLFNWFFSFLGAKRQKYATTTVAHN